MLGLFLRHLYYMIYKIVYISFFLMFLLSFSSGCSSEEKDIPDPDSGIPGGDEGSDDGDKETDKVSPFMCTGKCRNTRWKAGIENQVLQA